MTLLHTTFITWPRGMRLRRYESKHRCRMHYTNESKSANRHQIQTHKSKSKSKKTKKGKNSPCSTRQEQTGTRHVLGRANPPQRQLAPNILAGRVECRPHHLCRKRPARQHVAGDVSRPQLLGQHARHVVQAGLARGVGNVGHGGHADAVDAAEVDHAGRVLLAGNLFEQRQTQLRQGEDAVQVERQDLVPRVVRERVDVGAPGRAGVVDQHVQAVGFEGRQAAHEVLHLREVLEVAGQGVRGAAVAGDGGEFGGGGGAGRSVAAVEVDFGAVFDEALGDHAADALSA